MAAPLPESEVLYTDYSSSDVISADFGKPSPYAVILSSTFVGSASKLDLNKDGSPDLSVCIYQLREDTVSLLADARYIFVKPMGASGGQANSYTISIGIDPQKTLTEVPFLHNGIMMAKGYNKNDVPLDAYQYLFDAFLHKEDHVDMYKANGRQYVALKMEKGDKVHYAWVQLEIGDFHVKVLDFAFSKVSGKALKAGATALE